MATVPKRGSYLNLEDVRVSYNRKTDSILLTAADPDLQETGGLKVDISRGTALERQLRSLLREKGVLKADIWPEISAENALSLATQSPEHLVNLGTDIRGEAVSWDIDRSPSLWVHGGAGSGTTLATRLAIRHALRNGWTVCGVDLSPGGIELKEFEGSAVIAHDFDSAYALIERASEGRFENRTLLVLHDLPALFELGFHNLPISQESRLNSLRIMIEAVARIGRSTDVHILARSSNRILPAYAVYALDSLSSHLIMGSYHSNFLPGYIRRIYGFEDRGRGKGRGMFFSDQEPVELQINSSAIPGKSEGGR